MRPEDAFAEAQRRAAERRAAGGYVEADGGLRVEPTDRVSNTQLLEWALLEPDVSKLRSTRRLGAPVTWLKRLLLRGLQQYHNELTYQQTRFNIHVLKKLVEIEERLDKIEEPDR